MQQQKRISLPLQLLGLIAFFGFAPPTFADSYNLMMGAYFSSIIIQSISIILGLSLFLGAIFKLKRYGESRTMMSQQMTLARPLAMMLAGVALLCLPVVLKSLSLAIWGDDSPLSYPLLSGPAATDMVKPVIAIIRVIGVIGVVRGIVLMSRVGGESSQPGAVGKAILHIIGGLMCIQILSVYNILVWLFDFGI